MLEQDFIHIKEILERLLLSHKKTLAGSHELAELTIRQFYYLKVIKQLGQPPLTALARNLQVSKPSVTAIINKLTLMGYINKISSTSDRRVSNVRLTLKGQRMVQAEDDAMMEFCSQVRSLFSEKEIEDLEFFLAKIVVKVS
jgi:DNA-binding MarR family transcriptional regulator